MVRTPARHILAQAGRGMGNSRATRYRRYRLAGGNDALADYMPPGNGRGAGWRKNAGTNQKTRATAGNYCSAQGRIGGGGGGSFQRHIGW